jgi:hypothetical protein
MCSDLSSADVSKAVSEGRVTPISIGPACTASELLDHLGLRQAAFPFDWIVSSLPMVEHCLDDDFRTFLDPTHYRWRTKRGSDHAFYRDKFGVDGVFPHHKMPANLPHFERAVGRFRTAPNPVFVYMKVGSAPDPGELERVGSKLGGPLLAYVLLAPRHQTPHTDLPVFRLRSKWDFESFCPIADAAGLSARVLNDVAVAAGLCAETA